MSADPEYAEVLAGLADDVSPEERASIGRRILDLLHAEGRPLHEDELRRRLDLDLIRVRKGMWWAKGQHQAAFHLGDLSVIHLTAAPIVGRIRESITFDADDLAYLDTAADPDDDEPDAPDLPDWARRMCTCAGGRYGGCGLVFTGVGAFDAHRTGPWRARRCLTPDELREKGYEPNEHGRWGKPSEVGA